MFNYNLKVSEEELTEYLELSLKEKVRLSKEIISEFVEDKPLDKVFISSSFGKDSVVLIDLVRSVIPECKIVYVDTGIEPESCRELSEVYQNTITLHPKKDIKQVTEEYGYMIPLGKDKANAIEQVRRNLHDGKFDTWRVRQMRGNLDRGMWDYSDCTKWLVAPFKISDKCCYWLKKSPLNSFKNRTGCKYSFVGVTVEESRHRYNSILKNGFISKDNCYPIFNYSVTDVLQYIQDNDLRLASCYGDIVRDEDGGLRTSLFQRNGCLCCPVASQYESPNKFELLRDYDREMYDFVIDELGYRKVLEYFDIPF